MMNSGTYKDLVVISLMDLSLFVALLDQVSPCSNSFIGGWSKSEIYNVQSKQFRVSK